MARNLIPWHCFWRGLAVVVAMLVTATAAQAGIYEIDYTGLNDPTINGDLIITTMGGPPGLPSTVISIRGERNGNLVTFLSPYAASDQWLYPSGMLFDFGGLSFSTASHGDFNMFSYYGGYYEVSSAVDRVGYASSGMPIRVIIKAIPEPATLALLGAGCGALALARRHRRRRSAVH
jgi:hypothetical protein